VLALLFLFSVFYHAWIGIRDVLMDYIKPAGIRLTAEVLAVLFLASCAIWSLPFSGAADEMNCCAAGNRRRPR
jgi:succinate dehydrogenase / fumarate reductase membrane anchor subunit